MKATLVREVIETDYSGEHSVKRMQTVECEIDFEEPVGRSNEIVGEWQLANRVRGRPADTSGPF